MEARDGAVLRADGYSPTSVGCYPVLLQRTPYAKVSESNAATARNLAARGYVVAVQDIRGRYASEGDFIWQFQDGAETFDVRDGYDAVERARAWCSTRRSAGAHECVTLRSVCRSRCRRVHVRLRTGLLSLQL